MAPSKRQASPTKSVAAKKSKTSPVVPIPAEIEPVFDLLQQVGLPESCKEMLQAAALPCLRTAKENRHAYQEEIADILHGLFSNTEAGKQADVTEIEEKYAELTKEHGQAEERANAARTRAAEAQEKSDALGVRVGEAEKAVETGKAACQAEHDKHGQILGKQAELVKEKERIQKIVSDMFQPLEAAVAELSGRNWQRRDRMLKELVECLRPLGLEESLALALPPALKEKVDQRGVFGKRAIKFASDLLAESIDKVSNEIASLEGDGAQQRQKAEAAEAEVENLRTALNACREEYNEMQNQWATEQTTANEDTAAVKSFDPEFKKLQSQLEASKSHLATFACSMSKFVDLKNNGAKLEPQTIAQAETADATVTPMCAEEQ